MVVSVIIPTYNRSHFIEMTLKSMVEQRFNKDDFELIIADNNSIDNTAAVVSRFIEEHKSYNIIYLKEPRQGVHYARNTAAKISKGTFLYFTDDDMIASPSMLNELLYLFTLNDKVASVTGSVLPKWEAEPPVWVKNLCNNYLLSLNDPPYDLIISDNDCNVFSCHQMIKREVFFASGGFNPENTKGVWIGDGETGLNLKIKELGFKFASNKNAVIHHIIPTSRTTQQYLNKRKLNQGNCDSYSYYRANLPTNWQLYKLNVWFIIKLIFDFLKTIVLFVLRRERWRLKFSDVYYHISKIKYNWRLLKDKEWKALVLRKDWLKD